MKDKKSICSRCKNLDKCKFINNVKNNKKYLSFNINQKHNCQDFKEKNKMDAGRGDGS